ncbi:hypothetical protein QOT17_023627 [Balamuthia mandrillaris]
MQSYAPPPCSMVATAMPPPMTAGTAAGPYDTTGFQQHQPYPSTLASFPAAAVGSMAAVATPPATFFSGAPMGIPTTTMMAPTTSVGLQQPPAEVLVFGKAQLKKNQYSEKQQLKAEEKKHKYQKKQLKKYEKTAAAAFPSSAAMASPPPPSVYPSAAPVGFAPPPSSSIYPPSAPVSALPQPSAVYPPSASVYPPQTGMMMMMGGGAGGSVGILAMEKQYVDGKVHTYAQGQGIKAQIKIDKKTQKYDEKAAKKMHKLEKENAKKQDKYQMYQQAYHQHQALGAAPSLYPSTASHLPATMLPSASFVAPQQHPSLYPASSSSFSAVSSSTFAAATEQQHQWPSVPPQTWDPSPPPTIHHQ